MNYLSKIGWNEFFQNEFNLNSGSDLIPARIAVENKERYYIFTENGLFPAEITGKLLFNSDSTADLPKVGDWVSVLFFEQEGKGIIHNVLKEKVKYQGRALTEKQKSR